MRLNYIDNCDNIVGLRALPDACIDLTVTSPPYDNLRTYNGFTWDFEKLATDLYRVTKPGGVVVWIVNDATIKGSETGTSFKQALYFKETGFNLHDTMIWEKPTFTATGSLRVRYASVFEYMFVLSKGNIKTFNPIKDKPNTHAGQSKKASSIRTKNGWRKMSKDMTISDYGQRHNIWRMPTANGKDRTGHPAPLPEQLATDHIISWSNPGDVVLDPFMGSGTTAVACLRTGRSFIGFEISDEYCQMANQRIADTVDELLAEEVDA